MPGNEVGDRVHNFFGQDNLSQGQYNSQAVDGNWPGLSNNFWASSQRTAGAPFISNLKNFNVQQSDFYVHKDSEQGHTSSPHLQHGLNLPQSNLRQESGRNQLQNQQTAVNSYMQGHQVFQTRPNEANNLRVDTESDWHNMSRGMSVLESQGSGLEHYRKNLTRTDTAELPVNFDFFGAQQQISGRHPGMMQSIPRQLTGINDMQLLQQQVMLTQMQELQRQQQFHQLEGRQQNSITPASSISKQTVGNHSTSLINGMPINEASNLTWQPEVMATSTNPNWLQHGASPVMQGSSNGLFISPEQRQALRLMGLVPNQGDHSLYGLPISSSRGTPNLYSHAQVQKPAISQISIPHQLSHVQGDKPVLSNISASHNLFPAHQYATFSDQTNTNHGTSVSRPDIEGKSVFGSTVQGINSGLNMRNLQKVDSEKNKVPIQDYRGKLEAAGSSETSQDKMALQVPPPSQNVATLDPTEEKILFGSDGSLCGAFGRNTGVLNMLDGIDSFNGVPSLQSGSWSALMQSAIAETSSSDMGIQEEWSSLNFGNTDCLPGNEQPSTNDCSKQQSVWAENNLQSTSNLNSSPVHWPDDVNSPNVSINYSSVPGFNYSGLHTSHEQHDRLQTHGNAPKHSGLDINDKGMNGNLQVCNEESALNGVTVLPNSGTKWVNRQSNQQLPNSLNIDVGRDADSSGRFRGIEGSGKYWQHMEKNPSILESSMNDKEEGESHDMKDSRSDKSTEDFCSNFADHRADSMRENVCFDDNDLQTPKSSNQVNQRSPPVSHKFQYHPMGDLGVNVETSHENKHVMNSQQLPLHPFGGLRGQDQSYLWQSKFHHTEGDNTETDKGDSKSLVDNISKGILPGHTQKQLTSFDRSVGNYAPNKIASPSQNILELLHKVDQSREHGIATKTSSSNHHLSSRVTDTEASVVSIVHPQQNQSSSSQGFGLQLAPPIQRLPGVSSQGSVLTSSHVASEMGAKGHTWLASTQTLPSQRPPHGELRNNISGTSGQTFDKASPYSVLGNIPQAFASDFPFSRILAQNQNMATIGSKVENTHDMENTNKTDKSAEGLGSNSVHHKDCGVRENVCFDGSDLHSPKLSNQVNHRSPISGKFQYHPMGGQGVNAELSYGNQNVVNSQPMPQQPFGGLEGQDRSYVGQSKFGQTDGDNTAMKGNAPTIQGDSKSLVNNSLLAGHNKKTLASFDKSIGSYASNKTASPRMLDTESSDGSVVHPQQNQSSLSQGFGLQLAPPSQRLPVGSSHGSSEAVLPTSHVAPETGDKGHIWLANSQTLPSQESSHMKLRSNNSGSLGQIFDKPSLNSVPGNIPQAFSSGSPFSRLHSQNINTVNHGRQVANSPCANVNYIDRTASMNQIYEYCERPQTSQSELASAQEMSHLSSRGQNPSGDPGMQILASEAGIAPQPCATFSESQHFSPSKGLHNVWASVYSKQHPNPSKIPSHSQPIHDFEMTTGPQKPGDKDSEKDEYNLSDVGPSYVHSNSSGGKEQFPNESSGQQILPKIADAVEVAVSASHVKESVLKCSPDGSHSSPTASSRDMEAFGRSLMQNNILQQSFSLLPQHQSLKSMEFDLGNRDVKKIKISDNALDKQETDAGHGQHVSYGYNAIVKDVTGNHSSVPPSDPCMLNFLSKRGNGQDTNTSSPEAIGYIQKNAPQISDSDKATARSEHSLISPLMAPSWFEQYGTFKNGQILRTHDKRNMTPPRHMDQTFVFQNQSESLPVCNSGEQVNSVNDPSHLGNTCQSPMPALVASEHVSSQLLPPAVEADLVITRLKKRKSAISELVPWHIKVAQGSERLRDISAAELDWAQATNRLIEKIEDAQIVEDLPLTLKSKRRLVLTSQLMQQILDPPPGAVLSADVKLHHEGVIYSVSRLALGNACSSVSLSVSNELMPPGGRNILSEKLKSSEKIDRYILKVVEDLVGRATKLENDVLRLDSRASILDLRVDCQDIERFSVINRFAKFHGRGQNDGAETSSSSDATASALKMYPQKYVTAIPMPRNLPDRVQCLSL